MRISGIRLQRAKEQLEELVCQGIGEDNKIVICDCHPYDSDIQKFCEEKILDILSEEITDESINTCLQSLNATLLTQYPDCPSISLIILATIGQDLLIAGIGDLRVYEVGSSLNTLFIDPATPQTFFGSKERLLENALGKDSFMRIHIRRHPLADLDKILIASHSLYSKIDEAELLPVALLKPELESEIKKISNPNGCVIAMPLFFDKQEIPSEEQQTKKRRITGISVAFAATAFSMLLGSFLFWQNSHEIAQLSDGEKALATGIEEVSISLKEKNSSQQLNIASLEAKILDQETIIGKLKDQINAQPEFSLIPYSQKDPQGELYNYLLLEHQKALSQLGQLTSALESRGEQFSEIIEEKAKLEKDLQDQVATLERTIQDKENLIIALQDKALSADKYQQELQALAAEIDSFKKESAEKIASLQVEKEEISSKYLEIARLNSEDKNSLKNQFAELLKEKEKHLQDLKEFAGIIEVQKNEIQALQMSNLAMKNDLNEKTQLMASSRNSNSTNANASVASAPKTTNSRPLVVNKPRVPGRKNKVAQTTPLQHDLASLDESDDAKVHIVEKGDTLTGISQKYYGTSKKWKEIYEANKERLPNQNRIKEGTSLVIP